MEFACTVRAGERFRADPLTLRGGPMGTNQRPRRETMKHCTPSFSLALTLAVGALLPLTAQAQIGVQKVSLGYEDSNGRGTLSILPLEHPQSATDAAPYRAVFALDRSGALATGAGIYQYLP